MRLVLAAALMVVSGALPPHPRVIMTDARLQHVQALVNTDPFAKAYYGNLLQHADSIVPQPVVPRPAPGPSGILIQVRQVLDRVYTLSLAARLTGNSTLAQRGVLELVNIASNWSDWNPVQHFLDTAEAMHTVGVGYDSLLPFLTQEQQAAIISGMVSKGFQPYLQLRPSAWWHNTPYNWNGVCSGGAIVGALSFLDAPGAEDTASQVLEAAVMDIRSSLASYAPAGAWEEGTAYEDYQTRYIVAAIESLTTSGFVDNATDLLSFPGLNSTCLFTAFMTATGTVESFDWSDSEVPAGPNANMFWLADKFNVPVCAEMARILNFAYEQLPAGLLGTADNIASRQLLYYTPIGSSADVEALPLDMVYDTRAVATFRRSWNFSRESILEDAFLGFKGGSPSTNHAHMDAGSFVYEYQDVRFASDMGADSYAIPGYFDPVQRWTIFRLNASGHNILRFDEANQVPAGFAHLSDWSATGAASPWAIADLTPVYTAGPGTNYSRGAALINDRTTALIVDELQAGSAINASQLHWQFMTTANVTINTATNATLSVSIPDSNSTRVVQVFVVVLTGSTQCPGLSVTAEPINLAPPANPSNGWTRVRVTTSTPATCSRIAVQMGPSPATAVANPLALWPSQGPVQV